MLAATDCAVAATATGRRPSVGAVAAPVWMRVTHKACNWCR